MCCATLLISNFTLLMERIRGGEALASADLVSLVYEELRRLAATQRARESTANTLQPTALLHEAWLQLGESAQADWQTP